jgi:hypothetical protein
MEAAAGDYDNLHATPGSLCQRFPVARRDCGPAVEQRSVKINCNQSNRRHRVLVSAASSESKGYECYVQL